MDVWGGGEYARGVNVIITREEEAGEKKEEGRKEGRKEGRTGEDKRWRDGSAKLRDCGGIDACRGER
jgi:ribosomal protein L19E